MQTITLPALTVPAAVANGISLSQTVLSGASLLINGSLATGGVASLVTAQRVGLASTGNLSSINFTVTGTNRYGNPITEVLAGPNNDTVNTLRDFLTVTSIKPSAAVTTAMTAGTVGIASTPWQQLNPMMIFGAGNTRCAVNVTGTVNYTVEGTLDDPNAAVYGSVEPNSNVPPIPWDVATGLTAATANAQAALDGPWWALRLTMNSGSGSAQLQILQAGLSNL